MARIVKWTFLEITVRISATTNSFKLQLLYRKKSISPLTYGVDYITPNLWNGLYHPLNFSKPVKLPPKAVSKNHSKSQTNQKNGKSNCSGLQMSRSTQWTYNMVCFSIFFTAMKKNIDLKLQQKNILKHIILYVQLFTM